MPSGRMSRLHRHRTQQFAPLRVIVATVVIAAAAEAGALEEAETELHHPMDDEHST